MNFVARLKLLFSAILISATFIFLSSGMPLHALAQTLPSVSDTQPAQKAGTLPAAPSSIRSPQADHTPPKAAPPAPPQPQVMPPKGVSWKPLGPDGGDGRSLAVDPANPERVFMGTSAGQLYLSTDGGGIWSRYARLGERDDNVLDHIVIDPRNSNIIYVAVWSLENSGGDLFRSRDGGQTWQTLPGLHGKSIRAFALAPSDSHIMVAGALDGVFRSMNAGETWERISPENQRELRNVESLAIDPQNPDIIYIGTFHLPWKTSNGGRTWENIKRGVIDDSDVFSIIIDPRTPSVVYASACSGIYKSDNSGSLFQKVKGMPFSARRTRVMKQDPINSNIVYAGTTEGLWKTVDGGKTFRRMTPTNIIVNDVSLDPRDPQRVLLATDRGGILFSTNGGQTFINSSRGFTHRQVAALIYDRDNSDTLYAGIINDKEFGGVFVSKDAGSTWKQVSNGLGTRDVFSLRQAEDGRVVAGTNRGIFELLPGTVWKPLSSAGNGLSATVRPAKSIPSARPAARGNKKVRRAASPRPSPAPTLERRITSLEFVAGKWFAATSAGFYSSSNQGKSWSGGPLLGYRDFVAVHAANESLLLAARNALLISNDLGTTWNLTKLPEIVTNISDVTMDGNKTIWVTAREGAFRSYNGGETWDHVQGLPVNNLTSVTYDAEGKRLLITSSDTTQMFETRDGGNTWRREDSGWDLRALLPVRGRLLGITAFDGVVMQQGGPVNALASPENSIQRSIPAQ